MHFRKIAIRGYRSLVRTDLTLGKITVVLGPSDVGKSNLVRALRDWATYTSSNDIVTWGKEVVRVAVAVGESHKVVFEKTIKAHTKGENKKVVKSRYVVKDAETGKVLSYEKIGRQVPDEILEITGVRPVVVGEKGDHDQLKLAVHFSEQGDNWFLVGPKWTASQVSKVIGKVSGVDSLILANRDLVNKRTAANREAKSLRERISRGEEELEAFADLERAQQALEEAEELLDQVAKDERALAEAMKLLARVREKRLAKEGAERRASAYHALTDFADASGIDDDYATLEEAQGLAHEIAIREEELAESQKSAQALRALVEHVDATSLVEDFTKAADATDLTRLITRRESMRDAAQRDADAARERVEELAQALEDLADSDTLLCPLCGQPAHSACRKALKAEGDLARSQE